VSMFRTSSPPLPPSFTAEPDPFQPSFVVPWWRTLLAMLVLAVVLVACRPAQSPEERRATERAIVIALSEGVAVADMACADLALAKKDAALARECDKWRDAARTSLQAAELALDRENDARAGEVRCAFANGLASAKKLAEAITGAGGKLPYALRDALMLAPMLGGGCEP
jgi:hypothetical protein